MIESLALRWSKLIIWLDTNEYQMDRGAAAEGATGLGANGKPVIDKTDNEIDDK